MVTVENSGYVETYKLACSIDGGNTFLFAANSPNLGNTLEEGYLFDGNSDETSIVTNDLGISNLVCNHIRYFPTDVSTILAPTVMELYVGK